VNAINQEFLGFVDSADTLSTDTSLLSGPLALIRRDLGMAWQQRSDLLTALSFFAVVVLMFPLASGADKNTLQALAPGVLWVAALLAHVLAAQRVFADDARDGSLEQWLIAPQALPALTGARMVSQWLSTSLPLVLIAPILVLPFGLPTDATWILCASLLIGTPALTAIGITAAALTLRLRQGAALLALLVLPLEVPVLIFGAGAVDAVMSGMSTSAHFSLLAAFSLLAVPGAAFATATALRIAHA
jgi:heme exporter protein B